MRNFASMHWAGKIIGGTLGLLALGPFGAALGTFIGHQFDADPKAGGLGGGRFMPRPQPARVNALFFPTSFRVMGHIAKADGRVSEQEIASARAIMNALRLNAQQTQAAIGYFQEGKRPGFDLDTALLRLRAAIAWYPDLVQFFLEIQMQAALAGNGLADLPRARLRRVAQLLGLSPVEFARLEALMRGSWAEQTAANSERLAQAYRVLEVSERMSNEQIVRAYRRQMSRHHPDKLKANGLPDSMLERAKERTQRIQAAYELVRSQRGMR